MVERTNNLYKFENIFVLYNPVSTNAKKSRRRIKEIKELFPARDVQVVETSPAGDEANRRQVIKLAKSFNRNTLFCIASGDGTISLVLQTLLTSSGIKADALKAVILPLWGGNANDLAHMANGYSIMVSIKKIMDKGRVVPVYPLKIELGTEKNTSTRIAACYASFGATAYAAKNMETPSRRSHRIYKIPGIRLLVETGVVIYSFTTTRTYRAKISGRVEEVYEHLFINGSRLAKMENMPVKLARKEFYEALQIRKSPTLMLNILKALRSRSYGRAVKDSVSFELKSPTLAQFDGELMNVAKGIKVVVSICQKPFYVLSTRLKTS